MEQDSISVSIAKTIIEQINFGDKSALMAWGASNIVALRECKQFQGGVKFHVNGSHFQGNVYVRLRHVDDYSIAFVSSDDELVKEEVGVYCDMLVDVIDYVEGK